MSTMSDVAKRAGVSLSTVSYVLSGKRAISEPTRQRVLAAIDELDFHPNQLGRALASQRSNTIALLFPALARGIGELQLEFVTSAAETASQHGYSFLLSISPDEDDGGRPPRPARLHRRPDPDGDQAAGRQGGAPATSPLPVRDDRPPRGQRRDQLRRCRFRRCRARGVALSGRPRSPPHRVPRRLRCS